MDDKIIPIWKRILALLIDLVVLGLLGVLAGFMGFVSPPTIFSISIFLIPIVQFIYFITAVPTLGLKFYIRFNK